MTFITTALVGHQYLVEGEDSAGRTGSTILDGAQFDEILASQELEAAHEDFDRSVERFFEPLTSAADRLTDRHTSDEDPLSYYVVSQGQKAVEGKPEQRLELHHDTMVLRALRVEGPAAAERVRWVGTDRLVITKAVPASEENTAQEFPAFIQELMDQAAAAGAAVYVHDGSDFNEGGVDIDVPDEFADKAHEPEEDFASESTTEEAGDSSESDSSER